MARSTSREDIAILHQYGLHIPSRTIFLRRNDYTAEGSDPGVDHLLATGFLKNLLFLEDLSKDPIKVVLSTPGGLEVDGMAIYDAIVNSNCHITTTVQGEACSMGSYILQAADHRIMAPHSIMMLHHGSSNGVGLDHKKTAENWMKFEKRYAKRLDQVLLDRIQQKHPSFTAKRLDALLNFDTILMAEDAVRLGLADTVQGGF